MELNGVEQQLSDIKVTVELMMKQLRKTSNWKSAGPDGLQGFWIKNFSALKDRIVRQLNWCLQDNSVPDWMTRGRTVLIVKDIEQRRAVTNFRPIIPAFQ